MSEWLAAEPDLDDEVMLERIITAADEAYAAKTASVEPAAWHQFERHVMLQSLDTRWRDHLAALDQLRQGIHLRGYAQKNPKQEYKRESFELFEALLDAVRMEVTKVLMTVQVRTKEELAEAERQEKLENVEYRHAEFKDEAIAQEDATAPETTARAAPAPARSGPRVGRNDACPCGSGKKYKHCHGKLA